MKIKSVLNKPYKGKIVGHKLIDDSSKVYYVDIKGREPETKGKKSKVFEWNQSGLDKSKLANGIEKHLADSAFDGMPHIFVAFPHVTVGFVCADAGLNLGKNNLYRVGLGQTPDLENIDISQDVFPYSVGTLDELKIVGQENIVRAKSNTMEGYLSGFKQLSSDIQTQVLEDDLLRVHLVNKGEKQNNRLSNSVQSKLTSQIQKYIKQSIYRLSPHFFVIGSDSVSGYRWGDPRFQEQETNLYRADFRIRELLDGNHTGDVSFSQVGCPGELHIISQEARFREEKGLGSKYKNTFVPNGSYEGAKIVNPNMIRDFQESKCFINYY